LRWVEFNIKLETSVSQNRFASRTWPALIVIVIGAICGVVFQPSWWAKGRFDGFQGAALPMLLGRAAVLGTDFAMIEICSNGR